MQNSALVGDVKCQLCHTSFVCFLFFLGMLQHNDQQCHPAPTGGARSGGNWQVVCLEGTGSKPEALCALTLCWYTHLSQHAL